VAEASIRGVVKHRQHSTFEGQQHNVSADALAPVLKEFFT
jgi:hypothetical protein